jgi:hypothetical protein
MSGDPEHFYVGPGYRDPLEDRDVVDVVDDVDGPTQLDRYDDAPVGQRASAALQRELTFGAGVDQLLAREELERRAGDGYQASLLGPTEQLALTDTTRRPA